nr:immunoglobulin light chain junction region [Macaca mulatta]MOV94396.1 immunoglobulin light chain junction region [Macaca mulatta]MOV94749.1 immunoglobulin light chain junction region [Macaca mulatta]MOV94906.1 immunoglobulin light chain junction region [Macaca mulatta]MOV94954.1 immunoglobulin light chain junction region [Macaca mulatta]
DYYCSSYAGSNTYIF